MQKIPLVVLNGFLGSGKTTLFRSLLSQSKRKKISVCAIITGDDLSRDVSDILCSDVLVDDEKLELGNRQSLRIKIMDY